MAPLVPQNELHSVGASSRWLHHAGTTDIDTRLSAKDEYDEYRRRSQSLVKNISPEWSECEKEAWERPLACCGFSPPGVMLSCAITTDFSEPRMYNEVFWCVVSDTHNVVWTGHSGE